MEKIIVPRPSPAFLPCTRLPDLAAQLAADHVKCHLFADHDARPDPLLLARELASRQAGAAPEGSRHEGPAPRGDGYAGAGTSAIVKRDGGTLSPDGRSITGGRHSTNTEVIVDDGVPIVIGSL